MLGSSIRISQSFKVRLTEVDGDKVVFVEELLQHPPVDLLYLVPDLEDVLRSQPLEHPILVMQVPVKPGTKLRICTLLSKLMWSNVALVHIYLGSTALLALVKV